MSAGEERLANEAPREPFAPHAAATPHVDPVAIGAAVCILIGWFVFDSVYTEVGGVRLGFHFYNTWSVLAHPSRLLTGLAEGDGIRSVLFGALCLAVLASAFARPGPALRLLCFAPLALMLLCGALLYEKTSGDFFAQTHEAPAIGAQLVAFANTVAHRLSAEVSRHISLGLGAYLAFAASIVLAARGLPRS